MVGKGKGRGEEGPGAVFACDADLCFALVSGEGVEKEGVAGGISWLTLCALRHCCEL